MFPPCMRAVLAVCKAPRLEAWVEVPTLRAGEVLIKVAATAVNRGDLAQVRGHYPPPPGASRILGLEAAGVVVAEALSAVDKAEGRALPVGTRVMALLAGGGYAEYVAVNAAHCIAVPEKLSLVEAAAVPEAFLTALDALSYHSVGDFQWGDLYHKNVLIHAGASGVGIAASQIVQCMEGRAITTISAEMTGRCTQSIDLSPTETADGPVIFADKVERVFNGRDAVDLIIDPIFGKSYVTENARVLAPRGTIVVLPFLGGSKLQSFDAVPLFKKNANIQFSTLRSRPDRYKAQLVSNFRRLLLPHFSDRPGNDLASLRPVVSAVMDINEVAAAHTIIRENKIFGKCVLTFK